MKRLTWAVCLLLPLTLVGQPTAVAQDDTYTQALALHQRQQHRQALAVLAPALPSDSARAEWFRLAGNCWDALQHPDSALRYYKRGLFRFPKSGALHWEIGRQFALQGDQDAAVGFWDLGILAEPLFADNYFQAARAYSRTPKPVWALLYAELYLNLAPRTATNRAEAARLLLFLHRQAITFPTDSTALVKLTDQNAVYLADDNSSLIIPLPLALQLGYHAAVGQVLLPRRGTQRTEPLTILELAHLRRFVVENWATQGRDTSAANLLYHHHCALMAAGQWEAYHYWLMAEASPEAQQEAVRWHAAHPAFRGELNTWLQQHPLHAPGRTVLCGMLYE